MNVRCSEGKTPTVQSTATATSTCTLRHRCIEHAYVWVVQGVLPEETPAGDEGGPAGVAGGAVVAAGAGPPRQAGGPHQAVGVVHQRADRLVRVLRLTQPGPRGWQVTRRKANACG